jgi:hypothetical protein
MSFAAAVWCVVKVGYGEEKGEPSPPHLPHTVPCSSEGTPLGMGGGGEEINSLCPITTPPPSLAERSEFTMSRPPPPTHTPLVQKNLEINNDMKRAYNIR